ncbi:MAG: CBS domain-containing protein [Candidatus Gastranaerophilales bacterium]|nr:CBS domain-containing protein [Candidatus Gastranaerophilales bacterium]
MQFYVKDIMSTDLVTVKENTTIRDLIKTFADKDILGVPVINDEGFVSGVVSSIDILKNESSHSFYHDPFMKNFEMNFLEDAKFFDRTVADIMSRDLYLISPDESIAKMARIMYDKKIHRLLVTEYSKLVGIVSTFDLLKLLASSDEQINV